MKRQIMDAAVALFSKKGYYQTSMDDVAREAGVAKGSLYYHFKNKSQLFCETVVDGIDFISGEVQRIIDRADTPIGAAEQIIGLLIEICADYSGLTDIVMNELSAGIDADVLDSVHEAKDRFIQRIERVLDEGKAAGAVRPCDSRSVSGALLGFIYSYCRLAFEKSGASRTEIARQLTDILMRGLLK